MALRLKMPVYFMYVRKTSPPQHYEAELQRIYDGEAVARTKSPNATSAGSAMIRETPELWMGRTDGGSIKTRGLRHHPFRKRNRSPITRL